MQHRGFLCNGSFPHRAKKGFELFNGTYGVGHGLHRALHQSKHQVPDFGLGWANLNLYVVPQPRKAVHEFALGQIAEVATHHV
jgi:hypothetical protein